MIETILSLFAIPTFSPSLHGSKRYGQVTIQILELFNFLEHLPDYMVSPLYPFMIWMFNKSTVCNN